MALVRAKQAGEILGVTSATVRRWSSEGRLPFVLSAARQRLYDEDEMKALRSEWTGEELQEQEKNMVFYVRSSQGLTSHLENQESVLRRQYGEPKRIFKDKASGLNDNRPGLNSLIKSARRGEFTHLAITHKDRLTRFGFRYLEEHLKDLGVEILYSESEMKSPEEELMQDFVSLIASFSGKFYRLRGYEQQKKLLKTADGEVDKKNGH